MLDVLFVCTGNICRSPLAEAFLRDRSGRVLGGAVRVGSAGIWARSGHPPTPETVLVGGERGVDVEGHAATPLTPASIERADLIVGMTAEHRDEVVRMAPAARAKVFTLKELVAVLGALGPARGPGREAVLGRISRAHTVRARLEGRVAGDRDIVDPLGLGEEAYRAVAAEIEEAVDALVRDLFGVPLPAHAGEG